MTNQNERFAGMLDPCGLWVVWDDLRNAPAEAPGLYVAGLSEAEARRRCRFLNHRSLRVVHSGEHPLPGAGAEAMAARADRLKQR